MKEPSRETTSTESIPFRWKYILLPVTILLLSIILTAYFYPLLPGEVAYHFKDSSPDKWMSRGGLIAWMLTPQFFLTLLAGIIVWGTIRLSAHFRQAGSRWVERILSLMGNMIALPQIILGFAMLYIFSYNSYQIHLMPLWVFALFVMGLGAIILGIFFTLAIRGALEAARGGAR
ncbi:MAG: DUF1648 domain-containing protein [Dehalococcoidales bacterium]